MSFTEKLYTLRKGRSMSQEALADAIRVSRQAVSKWESGQSLPETEKLILLSDLFGVSLDFLVRDTAEEPTEVKSASKETNASDNHHYEYKSRRKLFGFPLVHVNLGRGLYTAKGIVAIGNIAVGVVALGGISFGILAMGGLALGVFAFAGFSAGLFLAIGGVAVGLVAVGGCAVGVLSLGGLALGKYAVGGCALASDIAAGGFAKGHIAIGDTVYGAYVIKIMEGGINQREQIAHMIDQEYPDLWLPIKTIFIMLGS